MTGKPVPAFQLTDSPIKVHTTANSVNHMTLTDSGSKPITVHMSATECNALAPGVTFTPSTFTLKPNGGKQVVIVTLNGAKPGTILANANVSAGHATNGASVGLTLDTQFIVPGAAGCTVAMPKAPTHTNNTPDLVIGLVVIAVLITALLLVIRACVRKVRGTHHK